MTKSILLVGVGGQGTILASKILTTGLMEAGYDVKMSEIHGMSQRGGSVSSQIRFGDCVQSPVIDKKSAELLLAFEKMEALRWSDYVKEDGLIVVNDVEIPSMSVITGAETYPEDVLEKIREVAEVKLVEATKIAEGLGNARAANIVLLGTIIKNMHLEEINWEQIIRDNVKPAFAELNLKALEAGMNA